MDWITVAAQFVNFLILVYLLKRFLYAPVIAAMDRRQARISDKLEQAMRREHAAQHLQEDFQHRLDELERTRAQTLAKTEQEVEAQRNVLMTAMRDDVAHTRSQWHAALQRERDRFASDLSAQSVRITLDLTRRTLSDLADEALEQRIIDRFVADLQTLDPERRALICGGAAPLVIYTAFVVADAARTRVRDVIRGIAGDGDGVEFRQRGDIICGIELVAGHARVGWSVQSHLAHLEREAASALAHAVEPLAGDSSV